MASSLVFLGLGLALFIVVFGIMFLVASTILGTFYTVLGNVFDGMQINDDWTLTYREVEDLSQYLIPLMMSLGLVVFIIKALMAAGVLGRD